MVVPADSDFWDEHGLPRMGDTGVNAESDSRDRSGRTASPILFPGASACSDPHAVGPAVPENLVSSPDQKTEQQNKLDPELEVRAPLATTVKSTTGASWASASSKVKTKQLADASMWDLDDI